MSRKLTYALGAAALIAVGAFATISIAGGGRHGHDGWGGHGHRHFEMMAKFDADKDGKLTQAEIDAGRQARFKAFDKDADGTLSLAEYEALWLDVMRERMVDSFQEQDDDGDAKVTSAEYGERFAHMVEMMDRNGDGVLDRTDMHRRHRMQDDDGPSDDNDAQ